MNFEQSKIQKIYMLIAVSSALMSNVLGAFGTHTLKAMITIHKLDIFKTGVQYQFYHSIALLMLAFLMFHIRNKWILAGGVSFITGIVLFPGSLYLLSLVNSTWIGYITPLGGLAFILGWFLLGLGIFYSK